MPLDSKCCIASSTVRKTFVAVSVMNGEGFFSGRRSNMSRRIGARMRQENRNPRIGCGVDIRERQILTHFQMRVPWNHGSLDNREPSRKFEAT